MTFDPLTYAAALFAAGAVLCAVVGDRVRCAGRRAASLRLGAGAISFFLALALLAGGALCAAVAVGSAGYRALTREDLAATVHTTPTGPQTFEARFVLPGRQRGQLSPRGRPVRRRGADPEVAPVGEPARPAHRLRARPRDRALRCRSRTSSTARAPSSRSRPSTASTCSPGARGCPGSRRSSTPSTAPAPSRAPTAPPATRCASRRPGCSCVRCPDPLLPGLAGLLARLDSPAADFYSGRPFSPSGPQPSGPPRHSRGDRVHVPQDRHDPALQRRRGVHPRDRAGRAAQPVVQKKTPERDGYSALQLGYGERAQRHATKALQGHCAKASVPPAKALRESRISAEELEKYEVGQEIAVDVFSPGQRVDVIGTSKGKGFAGVVKRHGFAIKKRTHGTHEVLPPRRLDRPWLVPGPRDQGPAHARPHGRTSASPR